jgi:integrase
LKWRSLKTTVLTVAKLRLADFEKEVRQQSVVAAESGQTGADETILGRFIEIYRQRTINNPKLAPATKSRRDIAVKALLKTWPGLANRDTRRITKSDCQQWAAGALREGTGFVSPGAKTVRRGMSGSAFNKCVEALRGIFEIAREHGVSYENPAAEVSRALVRMKRLELPTVTQFHVLVKTVAEAGARQSRDCADMVRLLAYAGLRLGEAVALRWQHVDLANNRIHVPGTKSETSYRTIPIFPPLAALLAEVRTRRGEEPADAAVLALTECKGALRSACTAIGIKKITHHDLRHLFATRCIENGVDIPTVSRWLGHSDGGALAMRVYGHLRQEHSNTQALKVTFAA